MFNSVCMVSISLQSDCRVQYFVTVTCKYCVTKNFPVLWQYTNSEGPEGVLSLCEIVIAFCFSSNVSHYKL